MPAAGEDLDRLLDAASGLTRYEAEGAFSLSLVRHAALRPEAVWELKGGALKKGGLLSLYRGGERFADLGGLEALKGFCAKALARRRGHGTAKPRGVLLLGVPGTGKSAFAKALGNETGRPTVVLDIGALLGGIVGETEGRTRQALRAIDAMAPCVCFVDEVEKALAGASGQHDSGVGARLFGTLLGWLSDHQSDVFVVATSNDVSRLPPEFARSERFDAIWFLDLPGSAERRQIWAQYVRAFALPEQPLPRDADWTGAEVRACCRLASLLDVTLVEAAHHVVPVAVTAAESVTALRTWAAGRCLDAALGGIYRSGAAADATQAKLARRVSRPGSN
jgi:SpoVK/Ycf46/Vps4 family AAA+-type ATPase